LDILWINLEDIIIIEQDERGSSEEFEITKCKVLLILPWEEGMA